MKIRKIQYTIDFVHIITFKDEYKAALLPYFGLENVGYTIQNENSIHENIKLVFNNETMVIFMRKEIMTVIYEGEILDIKRSTGVLKIFFDILEKIKEFKGFYGIHRHSLVVNAVNIETKEKIEQVLNQNPYLVNNPFLKVNEFACIYEFEKDQYQCKFNFGNYNEKDILKYDLTPFNTEYNKDLIKGVGLMCNLELSEKVTSSSFSKFKTMLTDSEQIISTYNLY